MVYQFTEGSNAILLFRAPKLDWNYRDQEQPKQILKEYFGGNKNWKLPEILDSMLRADNLYFDEACQIQWPGWTKGRVALIGDAGYAPSFFTGMGTSLALQGTTLLAKELTMITRRLFQTTMKNLKTLFMTYRTALLMA